MSLRGYVKKGKPAPWTTAFPEQAIRDLTAARRLLADAKKAAKRCEAMKQSYVKRLRRESKTRSAQNREYRKEAREFVRKLAGMVCPVWANISELRHGMRYGHQITSRITEVHHTRGRVGRLLLEKKYWLGVSKLGHRWIHEHPEEARKHGWLCEAGKWNSAD